jgi:GNAT superfamily N-acetyltransferase
MPAPIRLVDHLSTWLGAWPRTTGVLHVVGAEQRNLPGWDKQLHSVIGVIGPDVGVISVPPDRADDVRRRAEGLPLDPEVIAAALRFETGFFRYCDRPTTTPDTGEWVPTTDARIPQWLTPFNGDVLVAWDDDGHYGAGVGRKQHDRFGHELSVGTEPSLRGRGHARLLVATAARRVLADGAIPTYLHAYDNYASGKVAEAAGFPDRGWRVLFGH